jgi:CSLREA domain-containing protein
MLAFAATVRPARAATFTVDDVTDQVDDNPGDGSCHTASNTCTLRAAVQEANALAGADTILLTRNETYALSIDGNGEDAAATGDLDLTGEVLLDAPGPATIANAEIQGGMIDRVLDVLAGAEVTLQNIDITTGFSDQGGGIQIAGTATVYVNHCNVTDNFAGAGGGILNSGELHVEDSAIGYNNGGFFGGGIYTAGPTTLVDVSLAKNEAFPPYFGGGIYMDGAADVLMNNVTVALNDGGGIVLSSTYTGTLTVRNSIISDNTGSPADCNTGGPSVTSAGYNLFGDPGNCTFVGDLTGTITGVDPELGHLIDNGGRVLSVEISDTSPARDAGNPATPGSGGNSCAATDARDLTRLDRCDIGVYEFSYCPPYAPTELPGYCRSTTAEKSKLIFRNDADDSKDSLSWKWLKGTATSDIDIGDGMTGDAYALCIYDDDGLKMQAYMPTGGTCGGKPCWKHKTGKLNYKDAELTPDGAQKLLLKAGADGKAKVVFKAKGSNLKAIDPPWTGTVTASLITGGGTCFASVHDGTPKLNSAAGFNDGAGH